MAPRLERLARIDAALHVLDPDGGRVRSATAVTLATALAAGATALAPGLTTAAPMLAGALAMMAVGSPGTELEFAL